MFQVGDIVRRKDKKVVVITAVHKGYVDVLGADGKGGWCQDNTIKSTGRNIDIESILKKIR